MVATRSDLSSIGKGMTANGEAFASDLVSCVDVTNVPLSFAAYVEDSLMAVYMIPSFRAMLLSTAGALYLV